MQEHLACHVHIIFYNYFRAGKFTVLTVLLLIEADLKVDMSDEEVGYDRRLQGIADRHGIDSRAYELCRRNIEFLRSIGRP